MKIHFCDLCNESVPQSDLDQGRARMVKGRVVCAVCERAMSLAGVSEAAPAPLPVAVPEPSASTARPSGGGSPAVWMAAASLLVTAIVIYVFQQRVDRLDAADLGLARGLESNSGELRGMSAQVAQLPAQTAATEQRLAAKLEEALAAGEKQRAEFAAASQRAEQSLADVARALSSLRKDLDNGAVNRETRLDELSHRLAQSEDAQREMTARLEEYQKAEAARTAADAVAKALPEKPAIAAAAPAWNALLPNLADANPSTRWEAVDELGRTKDPAVIAHVTPLLRDSDLFVRMCAARVLSDLGTLQGVPALIDALEDAEPTVRESAWNALRTLTGKDFKFDPQGNEADRSKKVKSWREWWKKEGEPLLNGSTPADPNKPPEGKSGTQKS
jgi:HEAT repeat protein